MHTQPPMDSSFASSIFHPTDLSAPSEAAFEHALALTLAARSALTILHAGGTEEAPWEQMPAVRRTLEIWGLLAPGSSKSAVHEQLHLSIRKVVSRETNPINACLDYLDAHAADLLVLATEGRQGLNRWIQPSVAERLARESHTRTLFVPAEQQGLVKQNGQLRLQRILVPIDQQPDPRHALANVAALAQLLPQTPEVILLHRGDLDYPARLCPPSTTACHWQTLARSDTDVVSLILDSAQQYQADLIVMATAGHDGILDVLRGSVTEQVLRNAPCPLLAVPVDSD